MLVGLSLTVVACESLNILLGTESDHKSVDHSTK